MQKLRVKPIEWKYEYDKWYSNANDVIISEHEGKFYAYLNGFPASFGILYDTLEEAKEAEQGIWDDFIRKWIIE